jgi:hypothetical protein
LYKSTRIINDTQFGIMYLQYSLILLHICNIVSYYYIFAHTHKPPTKPSQVHLCLWRVNSCNSFPKIFKALYFEHSKITRPWHVDSYLHLHIYLCGGTLRGHRQLLMKSAVKVGIKKSPEVYRWHDAIRSQKVDVHVEDFRITVQTKRNICYCGQII